MKINPNASIQDKQTALVNIAAATNLEVKFAKLDEHSRGKYNPQDPKALYIDIDKNSNSSSILEALFHEKQHALDNKEAKFIPKDIPQNEFVTANSLNLVDMVKKL